MSATSAHLRRAAWAALLGLAGAVWLNAQEPDTDSSSGVATLLTIQGAIGPATADFIVRGIAQAQEQGAALVVIEMDTPGGLDTSMRDIIQAILDSSVPVATFVFPQGARAASAGTYILYASHVAAMAPATNLGAATPVAIGSPGPAPVSPPGQPEGSAPTGNEGSASGETAEPESEAEPDAQAPETGATAMERKAVNDAVAYIRSLAEHHGRNADWAERAVRAAESLSARQALDANVIDVVAADLADLLEQIDGREVQTRGGAVTLDTAGLVFDRVEPDWRTRLLAVISNPTVAYMLMLLGIYGLIFEGYNPGAIVPGVVGAIALLLALFAFQVLPINYAGLALIALGIVLMIAEFLAPSFGALGIGGVVSFVFGSLILIDTDVPGFSRPTALIGSIATVAALGLLTLVWVAVRARRQPVVSGVEQLTKMTAQAIEDFEHEGPVWVHGERWAARSSSPVTKGQLLVVTKVDGLHLNVEPAESITTKETVEIKDTQNAPT
ncbi:MAG TPA: NfeD family protein [Gammaproteobacteria bacterium]|nr:NfeD family protein [Gammaproteobacteria bacterium]